ncbi:nematocyst expressed protein 3-like [Bombina bombina]|uniref:nematocyst expressed protein 3-like n=1 Tax=Bombina bombina TaxID=8345 RepID=UPI00235AD0E4|nr:nematocyst expressed protein 3-like [Bombina bombina]
MTPGKIPGQRNILPLALRGSQDSHEGSMYFPPPPTTQSHGSQGFYPQTMPQEVPIGQAEWSHNGHQWDYQPTMRAPPSSAIGRALSSSAIERAPPSSAIGLAPPSEDGNIAESTSAPQAPSDAGDPAPHEPAVEASPAPHEPKVEAGPAPHEPAVEAGPAPHEPAVEADPAPPATADAGDPAPQAPRSPAAQEHALYSPLHEEYIALQRRLITNTESIQRGQ